MVISEKSAIFVIEKENNIMAYIVTAKVKSDYGSVWNEPFTMRIVCKDANQANEVEAEIIKRERCCSWPEREYVRSAEDYLQSNE